jgi:hypothetical protein
MRIDVPSISDDSDSAPDSNLSSKIRSRNLKRYDRSVLLQLVKEVSPEKLKRLQGRNESDIIESLTETKDKGYLVDKAISEYEIRTEASSILSDLSREEVEHLFKSIPSILKRNRKSRKLEMIVSLLKLLEPDEKEELIALKDEHALDRATESIEYPDLNLWKRKYQ